MQSARARSISAALVLGSIASIWSALPHAASAQTDGDPRYRFTDAERCILERVNRIRARRGLRRLDWDKQLGYVARLHARRMATRRDVFHDHELGRRVTRWRRLGQNTGRGPGCRSLVRSFMRSRVHRATILGRWRFMGVGVERTRRSIYVQHIFESRRDPGNVYRWP